MIKRFEFDPTKKCGTYSKGNRQKVALISAFSSYADLFILDEPTTGLDPLMEAMFQESILELKNKGKTVLLSSHVLAVVEKLCDKISIIRKGKIVESGTLDELRHLTRTSIQVETAKKIIGLEKLVGVHEVSVNNLQAEFKVDGDKLNEIIAYLSQFEFKSLISRPPSLEELFMHHYGENGKNIKKVKESVKRRIS
jgi:ABC-2 type transport system ATP-binding protein